MNKIDLIIGDWNLFLNKIFSNLKSVNIDVKEFDLDHIAYRATTNEMFESMSLKLAEIGNKIHRIIIRNRFIDIYQLNDEIEYKNRKIKFIELMAPAEGDQFRPGLEHVEFVIQDNLYGFVKKHNNINWNVKSIDREIGAEVGILFGNGASVKFKNQNLLKIFRLEDQKN